jgi:hypothetical protein
MVGGVATATAAQMWPFRIYSFPKEITIPTVDQINEITRKYFIATIGDQYFRPSPTFWFLKNKEKVVGPDRIELSPIA